MGPGRVRLAPIRLMNHSKTVVPSYSLGLLLNANSIRVRFVTHISFSLPPSLVLQEKPLSRSLQRGEDAQFDQVSTAVVPCLEKFDIVISLDHQPSCLYLCECPIFESHAPPTLSLICSWCRTLYNGPVCCRMLCSAQHKANEDMVL